MSSIDDVDIVLLVVRECFIYPIPPRKTVKGHRAADWNLEKPIFTGRLRVASRGKKIIVSIRDPKSGETFGDCPVEKYPGPAVEPVTDSSRYFVLRLYDAASKQHAFVGMGFQDRSDSFDFTVSLNDFFKMETRTAEMEKHAAEPYVMKNQVAGLAAGEKIKIKLKPRKKETDEDDDEPRTTRPIPQVSLSGGGDPFAALKPPPGGLFTAKASAPAPAAASSNPFASPAPTVESATAAIQSSNPFGATESTSSANPFGGGDPFAATPSSSGGDDAWGAFEAAPASTEASKDWVKF